MKINFNKLLKNKLVLYLTFFISLVTIFSYLVKQNYPAILFFTLILFLTKQFTNNMIIILGVSILSTNLLDLFRLFSLKHLENLENKQPSPNVKEILQLIAEKYFKDELSIEDLTNKKDAHKNVDNLKSTTEINSLNMEVQNEIKNANADLSLADINYLLDLAEFYKSYLILEKDNDNKKSNKTTYELNNYIDIVNKGLNILNNLKEEKSNEELNKESTKNVENVLPKSNNDSNNKTNSNSNTKSNTDKCKDNEIFDDKSQSCIPKPTSKKENMQSLSPAEINSKPGSGNINDATNKELAFDNLEKMFGNDNIRSFANEASSLNERQNKIMDQLKDVGPIMTQAMSLIKNIDLNAINNVSNKMTGMINNLQEYKNE